MFLFLAHRILRNLPICPNVNIRTRLIKKSLNQPLIMHDVCYTQWCLSCASFSQSAVATANTISKLKLISLHNKNLPKQLACGWQKHLGKAPRVPQPEVLQGLCFCTASLTTVPPTPLCFKRLKLRYFVCYFPSLELASLKRRHNGWGRIWMRYKSKEVNSDKLRTRLGSTNLLAGGGCIPFAEGTPVAQKCQRQMRGSCSISKPLPLHIQLPAHEQIQLPPRLGLHGH